MEIAVAAMAAEDHELPINYFLILVSIPYGIVCMAAICLAIELYLMLWFGFFSVIVIILNVQLWVLTGVEPETELDGMYVIADILAVAMIVLSSLLRYIREGDDANEDEDE